MRSDRPDFNQRMELPKLELPQGTVLEIEYVQELVGEVRAMRHKDTHKQPLSLSLSHTHTQERGQRKSNVIYILDVLSIYNEFYGCKPLKERCVSVSREGRRGSC